MWNEAQAIRTAEAAASYIRTKRIRDEKGVRWSIQDAFQGKHFCNDEISLYSGSAGVARFLLHLYLLRGDRSLLEDAKGAADYMIWRWENARPLDKNFSLYAYTTGYAGVAVYLLEIWDATGQEKYRHAAEEITEACIRSALRDPSGEGYFWSRHPGIVGNGGIILYLLYAAEKLKRNDWRQFAIQAGKYYVGKGTFLRGVDPAYFGDGDDLTDPNFPMGMAGIGYLLLKLFEASGDKAFLQAEEGILPVLEKLSVPREKGLLLPHGLPGRRNLFYLGYCHGPVGTIRYLYEAYQVRGEEAYRSLAEKLLEGLLAAGAPGKRSEGYWEVLNLCCGTAGMICLFLGLAGTKDFRLSHEKDLQRLAEKAGEVILKAAQFTEEGNAFWFQALDRITPERRSRSIGFYDGAAGIADSLLAILYPERRSLALDDPFPLSVS